MSLFKQIISGVSILIVLISCSRNNGNNGYIKDTAAPAITIVTPANNQSFNSGQTIQITATASDNVKVTQLEIHVSDKSTGALLRDIHSYPGDKNGTVQDSFSAQAGAGYLIKIIAYDPSQNLGTLQIEVSVN